MLKINDVLNIITDFAPLEIQADFDNSGLLYGDMNWDYKGALITLDLSIDVVTEAIEKGLNLIIEHHPSIFYPIKKLDLSIPKHRALALAIKNDIAVFSAHTNVDFANGGLNDMVMQMLGVNGFFKANGNACDMRIGVLNENISLKNLARKVSEVFDDKHVVFVGEPTLQVKKIAVINGGGGSESELLEARKQGADVFISADFKYNVLRLAKDLGYAIIVFGHYESEKPFIDLISGLLNKNRIENVHGATTCTNPLN